MFRTLTCVHTHKQTYIHRGRQIYLCIYIYIYVHICLTSNVNHIKMMMMMMIAPTTIKSRVVLTTMLIRSVVVLLMTAIHEELREQPLDEHDMNGINAMNVGVL